jgi:hypothetical protein
MFFSWEEIVEHEYALRLAKVCCPAAADDVAIDKWSQLPVNWTFAHYEQMARLLSKHGIDNSACGGIDLGSVKEYVESLEVSSCTDVRCTFLAALF